MTDEELLQQDENTLSSWRDQLQGAVRRHAWRRMQLLCLLLPFAAATLWVGYNTLHPFREFLALPVTHYKFLADAVFWGLTTAMLLYADTIVFIERSSTLTREREASRTLGRIDRRLQQLSLSDSGQAPAPRPADWAPAAAATGSRAPAHAVHPVHPEPPPPHLPAPAGNHPRPGPEPIIKTDRGPTVLNLDSIDTKECPMCAETVKARAKICRYCRYEFESISS